MTKLSPLSQNSLTFYSELTDFLVSHETFQLFYDKEWDMLITQPIPENLDSYYKSAAYKPHQHQSKSIFDKIYNYIRKRGYKYKLDIIKQYNPAAQSVLDYGTATGEFLHFLSKETFRVSGVEPNKNVRNIANQLLENKVMVSIDDSTNTYDVITLWHVLEHIPNIDEIIQKLKQKLNPKGIILVAVPNFKSFDAQYYQKHWAAYDVPRHLWHFSPKSVNKLFQKHRMAVIAQKPLYFDSFYVSLLSEKYKRGRQCLIKAFINGLRSNIKAKKSADYSSLIYVIKSTD
jgi:2-polyprenyl-3-methyl-5-hydroxy-6-metoxy-1,4-benzoquinol methylase